MDGERLFSEREIKKKVEEIAGQITSDFEDKEPLMIGVLKGSFVFLSDLVREVDLPLEIDFVDVESYHGMESTDPEIKMNTTKNLEERDIILVDDILDTGKTMNLLKNRFESRGARSIKICTLLDKPSRREIDIKPDYKGFEVPDVFVVGYGLDYNEKHRDLRDIYQIIET